VPAVVGVPVIEPVGPSIDSPTGRPVADRARVAPDWVSVAETVTGVIAGPDTEVWPPGSAKLTVLVTGHENVASIEIPAGRPVADQVNVEPDLVSEAESARAVMALPETLEWVPGLVTGRLSTFQVRLMAPAVPAAEVPPPGEPAPQLAEEL
jgi:hypothetical protein